MCVILYISTSVVRVVARNKWVVKKSLIKLIFKLWSGFREAASSNSGLGLTSRGCHGRHRGQPLRTENARNGADGVYKQIGDNTT